MLLLFLAELTDMPVVIMRHQITTLPVQGSFTSTIPHGFNLSLEGQTWLKSALP